MNIVLVDDEQVILNGLAKIIPSLCPDWVICDMYTDANDALTNCDWDNVQVALVDISMPGMDGLSLIAALRENDFDTMVIFVTAHADFEYAHEAAHLQMFDYLLKPVTRAALEKSLRKAQNEYEKMLAGRNDSAYIQANLHTLRKHFLGDIMFEERYVSPEEMIVGQRQYELDDCLYSIALLTTSLKRNAVKTELAKVLQPNGWMIYGQSLSFELLIMHKDEIDNGKLSDVTKSIDGTWSFCEKRVNIEMLADSYRKLLLEHGSTEAEELHLPDFSKLTLSPSIIAAVNYINDHYAELLSLSVIAENVYLHPAYLSNTFRKQTGWAVIDYINEVRITNAKRLLADPRNRIYWIVEQVGFSNQRYFASVFKKSTGMTPMQYRQNVIILGSSMY